MQKIISWNVASIRARMQALTKLLETEQPDIVLLQEIKSEETTFPFFDLKIAGYNAVICGQKSYNGVAILSKASPINIQTELFPESDNPQARFIQAKVNDLTVISVYVPNGNPPEKDPQDQTKLLYKLKWMDALNKHIATLIQNNENFVLGGDFNVIERDTDVYNPEIFRTNALMLPEVRQKYAELTNQAVTNTIRLKNPEPHTYSFWDFQMGAWARNCGILLDALFINTQQLEHIEDAGVLKAVRGWEKTSDHAPIYLILK